MNRDFAEMLKALAAENVDYLVVGAYAVAGHGIPRATGGVDLWVRPSPENAARLWQALHRFGAPRSRLSPESFTQPDVVYQRGLPPNRIDFLTTIDGVVFEDAWMLKVPCVVEGIAFSMLSLRHLMENKRATGRSQDLADVARLESLG
jgi:hypothetical protein